MVNVYEDFNYLGLQCRTPSPPKLVVLSFLQNIVYVVEFKTEGEFTKDMHSLCIN